MAYSRVRYSHAQNSGYVFRWLGTATLGRSPNKTSTQFSSFEQAILGSSLPVQPATGYAIAVQFKVLESDGGRPFYYGPKSQMVVREAPCCSSQLGNIEESSAANNSYSSSPVDLTHHSTYRHRRLEGHGLVQWRQTMQASAQYVHKRRHVPGVCTRRGLDPNSCLT